MNDEIERDLQDGNPIYLWTADTLDQDAALAMTLEESEAEMKRLQIRATRRSRRPTHRRALKAGAARLAPRMRGTEEPDLDDLRTGDDTPSAWHPTKDRHDVEMEAVAYAKYADLSPAGARALGIYLDLVSVGEIARPALDYERTRARLAEYVAQHPTAPAVLALRTTSTTMAFLGGGAA